MLIMARKTLTKPLQQEPILNYRCTLFLKINKNRVYTKSMTSLCSIRGKKSIQITLLYGNNFSKPRHVSENFTDRLTNKKLISI